MIKVVDGLVEIEPAFVGQVIMMTREEIFVQIVALESDKWRLINLRKSSYSIVIKIAKAPSDTELVKILPIDRNSEQQGSRA
jgi:hypothetical protein